jgi:hypothetical protein
VNALRSTDYPEQNMAEQAYKLSASPVDAVLVPGTRIIVGIELQQSGSLRVWLDSRHLDRWFEVDEPEMIEAFTRGWRATNTTGHFYIVPT